MSMRCAVSLTILMTVTALFLSPACRAGDGDTFAPWSFQMSPAVSAPASPPEVSHPSLAQRLAMGGIQFFISVISRVDGDRCPMYPTCSAYSMEAVKKHGFLIGFVMTADRLIHESNEMDLVPSIMVGNRYRYYDPLFNNDFWWCSCTTSPLDKM